MAITTSRKRIGIAAFALALAVGVGAGTTALVVAATDQTLVRRGQLGTLGWYSSIYATGNSPRGTVFDGANIWTANSGSNNVSKLNAATGALIGT